MGPRLHIKIPFIPPPQYSGFAECALSHNYQEKEEEFFLTHSNITPKKYLVSKMFCRFPFLKW